MTGARLADGGHVECHAPSPFNQNRTTLQPPLQAPMEPNQSPAFQFYPKDWLSSTSVLCMSLLEQGAYLRLLCCDWLNDGIPNDPEELARISGLNEGWSNGASTTLLKCFKQHPTKVGFLRNLRLQKERIKQEEWRRKSREGGIKSGKARKKPNEKAPNEPPLNQTPTKDEPKGNIAVPCLQSSSSVPEVLQYEKEHLPQIGERCGEREGSDPQNPDVASLLGDEESQSLKVSPKNPKKTKDPHPTVLRLNALFGRRPETQWSDKEKKAIKAIGHIPEEDLLLIEARYDRSKDIPYRRQTLLRLLTYWQSELDIARNPTPNPTTPNRPTARNVSLNTSPASQQTARELIEEHERRKAKS